MQIIIGGIVMGCIYALTAIGLILIFRTTGVVNFAHGEMGMFTTFIAYIMVNHFELPYVTSFLITLLFAALLGFFVYQVLMKWIHQAPYLNQIVLTLGLFMIFNGLAGLIWGYQPMAFPEAIQSDKPLQFLNFYITKNEIFIIGVTLLFMLLFFILFKFTKIGFATRAAAQNIVTAELMGIKVTRVFTSVWIIAAVLGGVVGMLTAPMAFLSPNMMFDILIYSFAAAVLGGFVSLIGAVLGGLIIGIFENVISYFISPEIKIVFVFLLIVLVLYIRPQGILSGAKKVKKV